VAGKYYQIRVTAKNVVGYSLPSDLLLVRCDAIAPLVPGIPQLINNPTATEVMLTWTVPTYDGSSPITAYKIYVIDANSITSRAPIQVVETTATVTGLSGGGLYAFRVSAVNAIGESAKSPISNFITTAPSGEGICNVTMRFLKVTTVINYPYGETGLPAHWLDLWKLDMAHTMNISSERIDSVNVYQQQDPLDVNNPITYVTFNVKSSIYSGAKSLVDAKALLLTATVDESSILHQGVASINVDTRFLEFDSTDPGVYEARRALGGNVNRFDENTMQIVGVVVFLITPSIICLKQIVAEWVQRRDARTAYRDRFD